MNKRGSGLGNGPVGRTGGYSGRRPGGSGNTGNRQNGSAGANGSAGGGSYQGGSYYGGTRSLSGGGLGKIIIIVIIAVIVLGGGGSLFGGLFGSGTGSEVTEPAQQSGGISDALSGLLGGFSGGGSVSTGWTAKSNSGASLNENVAAGARSKYTTIKGGGADTVTLMVYICGADLESKNGMASADIQEMLNANITNKNVNLIIYTGGAKKWSLSSVSSQYNQIHKVEGKQLITLVKNDGTSPMTKSSTLSNFIKYCASNYKADRYQLVLWDHGGGSISGYGYDEKNVSSGSMTLKGIRDALDAGGVKFDFIGFDTCLMATLENALMLGDFADYLVASEETEPGCGWYYTNWLKTLSDNTSVKTTVLCKQIIDNYTDFCEQRYSGQKTTLSLIDLAELEATVPAKLKDFASSTTDLIENDGFKKVSDARSDTREFSPSSKIDQVDLVHLACNIGTSESRALADSLLGAIKYNRTSSSMTNAYGLSVYFPYRKTSSVNSSIAACDAVGMDSEYLDCIRSFAALETGGQSASAGNTALGSLLGMGSSGSSSSGIDIGSLLGSLLGGMSGRSLDPGAAAGYIEDNLFDAGSLSWVRSGNDYVIKMSEEQWSQVHDLELNVFYDDGKGYMDLGLDNVYDFTDKGELIGSYDGTWLAIDGNIAAYYYIDSIIGENSEIIRGRIPVLYNGERANLMIVFDSKNPDGYIAGVIPDYVGGETETVSKQVTELNEGDKIDFVCDYYDYDGNYLDTYEFGEQITYSKDLKISNVYLPDSSKASAMYVFTDFYGTEYWTAEIPY